MKTFVMLAGLVLGATLSAEAETAVIHHQVSSVAAAQAAFDRGLLDYYAYNPEAAQHEFYTAADLDPHLAMAWWGVALSNAPNLNVAATNDRDTQARSAILKAKALEGSATPEDQAFIDAAAARFAGEKNAREDALETSYRDALQKIAQANPGDPDAAALYAEAALYVADPGDDWIYDSLSPQQRADYRARLTALLPYFQASLAKFPLHVGLEHFYIHTAQMAGRSDLAVGAATQLAAFTFPPEDSHLTHMPGHIFFDVGMYAQALDVAQRSVDMDYADFACCHPGYYSATRFYHNHNVSFLLYAMTQTGHTDDAVAAARRANNDVMVAKQLVAAARWQEVVALDSAAGGPVLPFARGLAYAHLGDIARAEAALAAIPDAAADSPAGVANVAAMRLTLQGEIAAAQHDDAKALQLLTDASAAATKGQVLGDPEMPALYYYSSHLALAALATKMDKPDVARAALQAELAASPKSSAATAALAKLGSF
jgi:hypothetical protein